LLVSDAGQLDTLARGQKWIERRGADEDRGNILPYDALTTSWN